MTDGGRDPGDEWGSIEERNPGDERESGDATGPPEDHEPDGDEEVLEEGHVDGEGPVAGVGGRGGPWTPAFLTDIRTRPRRRTAALVAAVLVGLAAAWIHWLGLFVAGALVGLASRTVPRALLTAVGLGVLALVLQILASPVMDAGEFLVLTPPAYVAIAAAVLLPAWGSLVRGVI